MLISILSVVMVTVWPGPHWISRPLEHQRKSLYDCINTAFVQQADRRRKRPLGCSRERLVRPLSFSERRIRSTSC